MKVGARTPAWEWYIAKDMSVLRPLVLFACVAGVEQDTLIQNRSVAEIECRRRTTLCASSLAKGAEASHDSALLQCCLVRHSYKLSLVSG